MYEPYYNLNSKPFQLRPDTNFFYHSKSHKRTTGYLEYGLSQGEEFVVILGRTGTGKTVLVRNFFSQLPPEEFLIAYIVHTRFKADDILGMVAAAFGLPCEKSTQAELLGRIEHFLLVCKRQHVILVIDEAHHLSPEALETLRMLMNFRNAERSMLQIFLIGQDQLGKMLLKPELEALHLRVTATSHLAPMDATDTQEYIEHRLRIADWRGDPNFSAQAHAAIFRYTAGVPQIINQLCNRLLLMGYLEEIHHFSDAEVARVIEDIRQEVGFPDVVADLSAANEINTSVRIDKDAGKTTDIYARLAKIEQSTDAILHLLEHDLTHNQQES